MNTLHELAAGAALLAMGGCASIPQVNRDRQVEVSDVVAVVECEVVAAFKAVSLKFDDWAVKSSLDLTLVQQVDASGNISWGIPIGHLATPSVGVTYQTTSAAHVDFITELQKANAGRAGTCAPGPDPSGTGLGLTAWIESTFRALGPHRHGGLSYTSEFEITKDAGARFGFAFNVPVGGTIGASGRQIVTHRLVVTVSPHIKGGPMPVIIVGNTTEGGAGITKSGTSMREKILLNPIGDRNLVRQSPVKPQPGSTFQVR